MKQMVVEYCSNCENEVELLWDVELDGYKTYCPYCGKRLMLCDMCQHDKDDNYTDNCDYCTETDTCKYNKKEGIINVTN